MLALTLGIAAHAQSFTVNNDRVLTGAGAPSVVHDGRRWLLFYETQTPSAFGCADAWSLGVSASADGAVFSALPTRLGPSSAFPCGARSPSAVWTDDGHTAVAFEAPQPDGTVRLGVISNLSGRPVARIVPELDGLSEPALARFDGEWRLLGVDKDLGLVSATSTDLVSFVVEPTATLPIGATPWSADGIESASLGCIDDPFWTWEAYYGGWHGSQTGWTSAISNANGDWYVGQPIDLWTDDSAWSGWDFATDGVDTVVFYEWTDPSGVTYVGSALDGSMPDPGTLHDRDCH